MKAEYDLSKMKSRKNPYASKLKRPVTMRLSEDVIAISRAWQKRPAFPARASSVPICVTVSHNIEKLIFPGKPDLKQMLNNCFDGLSIQHEESFIDSIRGELVEHGVAVSNTLSLQHYL